MVSACVLVRTERGRYGDIEDRAKQFKGVTRAYAVVGRFDVVVEVEAPTHKKLGEIINRIGRLAGVVFTETMIAMEV